MKKHQYGLALSGGAARAIAHMGVIKALAEQGIKPGIISGTSAGALVAAFYSEGYSPEELLKIVREEDPFSQVRFALPTKSLMRIEKVKKFLQKHLKTENIEDLPIPIVIGLTNFNNGELYFAEKGNLITHLIATLSVPTVFEPVKIGDYHYVDGGLVSNLPIEPLKGRCKKVIGVNVNELEKMENPGNLKENLMRTILIGIRANMSLNISNCDLYIEPKGMHKYSLTATSAYKEMFELGYKHASAETPRFKKKDKFRLFSFLSFKKS